MIYKEVNLALLPKYLAETVRNNTYGYWSRQDGDNRCKNGVLSDYASINPIADKLPPFEGI